MVKITFLGTRRAYGGDTGIKVLPKTKAGFKKAGLIDVGNKTMLKSDFVKKYPKQAQKYVGKLVTTARKQAKKGGSAINKTINQLFRFR